MLKSHSATVSAWPQPYDPQSAASSPISTEHADLSQDAVLRFAEGNGGNAQKVPDGPRRHFLGDPTPAGVAAQPRMFIASAIVGAKQNRLT